MYVHALSMFVFVGFGYVHALSMFVCVGLGYDFYFTAGCFALTLSPRVSYVVYVSPLSCASVSAWSQNMLHVLLHIHASR